jgi:hypothetical protein
MSKDDTLMCHAISSNTLTNATRYSYNSIQGHHHSIMGVERYADADKLRWSMTVGCLLDLHSPAARYGARAVIKRPILGTGMRLGGDKNILVISDLHMPYHHKDAFDFLYALECQYNFDEILNVGDVYDHHRGSYHESEPDSLGEEEEYYAAKHAAHELQSLFPEMVITQGNHDAIPQRKLKTVGLPAAMLSNYNSLYGTEETWEWKYEHRFNSGGGFPITHPMVLNKRGSWDKKVMCI